MRYRLSGFRRCAFLIVIVAALTGWLHPAKLSAASSIAYIQGNYSTPQTVQSTVTVPYAAAQAAGDLNAVVVGWNDTSATVSSVTDKGGNAYALAVGPTLVSGTLSQSIYYAKNIKAAAAGANTVTVTFSKAATYPDIRILEYSGADLTNPVDVTAASSGSGTTSSSGAATTANATDLIFGANMVTTSTTGPGSGFTKRLLTSPDGDIAEDEMVTGTGSYSATAPLSSGTWIMQMVAFRTPVLTSGSFTLSASPALVSVTQGNQGTSTITTAVSGGFNSSISLTASGAPSGTAVSFNPGTMAATGSGSSTMTIAVGSSAAAGTYTITVTGNGGGVQEIATVTLTVTAGPNFTLSASSAALTVAPGSQGTSTITTSVSGGFNSSVGLTASGAPSGATVSFNPSTIAAPGSGSSTMTIAVGSSTATGTYPITVTANSGGIQQTATVTLTVAVASTSIIYIQGNYSTPQTAQSTVTVPYAAAQAAGDLNVVVVGWNDTSATVSSVTDKGGNAYALAVGPTLVSGTLSQSVYYARNIAVAAAEANTVTVTFSKAAAYPDIRILEYSGADLTNPVDVTAASSGSGTTSSSGAATTANATDLIFGANMVTTSTTGPGSGFTKRLLTSPDEDIAEDEMVTTIGSYSATAPLWSGTWIMQMVAFRTMSSTGVQPPTVPGNLTATPVSSSQINLSWSTSTSSVGIANYIVERCQGAGCTNFAQVATPTGTTYNDMGLAANTSYSYEVQAKDSQGNLSGFSNVASATTLVSTGAAISYIQGNYAATQTSATTVSVPFTGRQIAGDLIVVAVGWKDSTATVRMVTDSSGNSYALALGPTVVNGSLSQSIYYAKNIAEAVAGGNIVTVTFSTAAAYPDIRILEYTGADPNNPVDVTAAGSGSGTTSSSGAATTANATDLIFGANTVTTSTAGAGSGFTARLLTSPDGDLAEDEAVTTIGSYSATAPLTSSGLWVMQMVTIRASSGGTQPPTAPTNLAATAASASQINLSWTAPTSSVGIANYNIYRCAGSGCTNFAFVAAPAGTTYSDMGLASSTSYSYEVQAKDTNGILSGFSNIASATTQSGGIGSITYVQGNYATPQTSQSTVTVLFTATQAAGDLNVVVVGWNDTSATVSSVTDASGNTYALAVGPTLVSGTLSQSIYYAKNIAGAAAGANAVTVTFSKTAAYPDIRILEYSGADPTNPVDVTAAGSGSGATSSSGAATTTNPTDLIFGANIVTTSTTGPGSGFTKRLLTSPDGDIAEDEIVSSTGSYSASAPLSSSGLWIMQMVAFRGAATGASGFSVSPRQSVVTYTETQQFTTSGGSGTPTWSVDGTVGGSSTTGTITTGGLYTPPSNVGSHAITAAIGTQTANATIYVSNYPGTFTYHNDNLRTGVDPNETVLTPGNVNPSQFGKLFSYSLDGIAFASPLYVANVNIPGSGYHNVVYVATENDSVYAFDADGRSSSPLWHVSFLKSGVTTVPCGDTGECGDIPTQIGITSTPVIDQSSGTLYVVAATKESGNWVQRLHALDITTGAEKFGGPVVLQASVPGTGDSSTGSQVIFDPLRENQRPALLLNNGVVYMGFGSHGDNRPWHGWVLGYNATTLQQVTAYNVTPNAYGGGIWQGGGGLGADANGNIYFTTSNGAFDVNAGGVDYGDSIEKLGPTGTVLDYFTPHDQLNMDDNNLDLGAGGPVMLVDQTSGPHPHLLISAGKTGTIYLINRDNMGHYNANNDSQIVQSLAGALASGGAEGGNYSTPVFFNGYVYFSAANDALKAFQLSNGLLTTSPTSQSTVTFPCRGGSFAVSANGTSNGIIWAIENLGNPNSDSGTPGVLIAFDASNLAHELYDSNQAGSRDTMDYPAKFSIPLVANGKVFVAGQTQLIVYGLLP